ncbi:MAG: hypothetical protein Q9184_008413 [Pyrenodesmia sp. 2 TL-2023]
MSEHDGSGGPYSGNLPGADGCASLPLTEDNLAAFAEGHASELDGNYPRDADGFGAPALWNHPDDDALSFPSTQEQAAVLATSLPLTQANGTALAEDGGPDLSTYPDDYHSLPSTQEQTSVLATLPLTQANLAALAGSGGPDLPMYPDEDIDRSLYPETQSQASVLQQEPHDSHAPHGSQLNGYHSADHHVMNGGPTVQSPGEDGADPASSTQVWSTEPPGYELDETPVPNEYGFASVGPLLRDTASSVDTIETEVYHTSQEEYDWMHWRVRCGPPDARIWSRLPTEIMWNVLENSDRETLISWSCTARLYYNLASNVLWRRISLQSAELMGYSTRSRLERRNTADKLTRASNLMMNFLAEMAFRHPIKGFWLNVPGAMARAPNERIKSVEVDFSGPPFLCRTKDWKKVKRSVFRLMTLVPNLRDLAFEGMLDPETFSTIIGKHDLRALRIRGNMDLPWILVVYVA